MLARGRAQARRERDWAEADRLRAELEEAGWKVVDQGFDYRLTPLHPPERIEDGRILHGSSASVPSRFSAPEAGLATVVLVARDWPTDVERAVAGVRAHAPAGTSLVIVADDPSPEQRDALGPLDARERSDEEMPLEIVWTGTRLGEAAALNAGVRRASAGVVIILTPTVEPTGDLVTPATALLADPTVAVAGEPGLVSTDLRRFTEGGPGDVDAIGLSCMAFRRSDYVSRGPLDEKFRLAHHLDIWWSLILRDEGPDAEPRRAVSVELPAFHHQERDPSGIAAGERDRQVKKNFYRVIDRFGGRRDLLLALRSRDGAT